jgi:hypothetical protein
MERHGRETSRLQSDVMRRIDDFEKRGLLIPKMADHYKKAIQKARGNPIKFKVFLKQMMEDLDRMDNESVPPQSQGGGSPTSSTFSSGTSTSASAFTEIASATSSNTSSVFLNKNTSSHLSRPGVDKMGGNTDGAHSYLKPGNQTTQPQATSQTNHHHLRSVYQKKASSTLAEIPENQQETNQNRNFVSQKNRTVIHQQSPLIVNVESSAPVNDDQLQELFVEMCFFARLGYVQPPCCLRCTYREALMDKNENSNCSRWVIWRKDTSKLLHPHEMKDNLLMVQCRAARRLLGGQIVNGCKWSANRQEIHSIES